jgi:hypothetical protein
MLDISVLKPMVNWMMSSGNGELASSKVGGWSWDPSKSDRTVVEVVEVCIDPTKMRVLYQHIPTNLNFTH